MRLLIYETSFRRIEAGIAAINADRPGAVEPVVMAADGSFPTDDSSADAAWMNGDVFFTPHARDFSRAILKSPDLAWVQSGAAGFDNPVFKMIVDKGARLTTSHGQAIGMSEYVLWGVLDHFQGGPARRSDQASRTWGRHRFREIKDSRWLIVGFGAIGQAVAERARGFGAHITAVRRNPAAHAAADAITTLDDLPTHLPQADVVVLCCPLTDQTRHLADAPFFARMKPGSVLVNVGRGGLVDEPALLAALGSTPEHAVLDVFETEPLLADSPFWAHPNVTLTPHASGVTDGQGARNDTLFLENLRRFVEGLPLLHEARPEDVRAG